MTRWTELPAHLRDKVNTATGDLYGGEPVADYPVEPERASPRQLEKALQRECWAWSQKQWWKHFLRHVPIETVSPDERRAQYTQGGLSPGWWDFELWLPSGGYCGLAVELKCLSNGLTAWQKERRWIYEKLRWRTEIVRDEKIRFVDSVERYLLAVNDWHQHSWYAQAQDMEKRMSPIDDWREK